MEYLNLSVGVLDAFENDVPAFQSDGNISVLENQSFVYEFNATDPNGDALTYSILYGDDADIFELLPSSGLLAFLSLPDFENPEDNNTDNVYEVTLEVSDGNANSILNILIQVMDEVEIEDGNHSSPDGNYTSPDDGYHTPDANYTSPEDDYHTPGDGYHSPDDDYHTPDWGYHTPDANYTSPEDDYHTPGDGYHSSG